MTAWMFLSNHAPIRVRLAENPRIWWRTVATSIMAGERIVPRTMVASVEASTLHRVRKSCRGRYLVCSGVAVANSAELWSRSGETRTVLRDRACALGGA
jgi:hypothetical protein